MRSKNSYAEKLLDPRWQQMRLRVFERDGWKCVICHESSKTLNAHHVQYHPYSEGPWDYELDEIITLCAKCHADEHMALDCAKASLILALVRKGYKTSYAFDCFTTLIETDGNP